MQGKYSFWIKVLSCLLAGLAITSYLIPSGDKGEDWIPLLSGFFDFAVISGRPVLSGILGGVFNALIAASLLAINTKSVNNVLNPALSVIFFLVIAYLHPGAAYFSPIHVAVLLLVWSQNCFIIGQKFTSMFLMSSAALFYAPLMWGVPLVLIISVIGAGDMARVAVKSLGGIVLPLLYVLCFRYMVYADALVFIDEYIEQMFTFSSPLKSITFTSLYLIGCVGVTALHAISYMFSKLYKNSIVTEHILKMEFMTLLMGAVLFFMYWGESNVPMNLIVAVPLAMLYTHYFTGKINAAAARVELILLCSAAVISRLSYFLT